MFVPKKSLGQNWLVNPRILDKIISAAEINSNDIVLEIGPGTGNLTVKLVQKVLQHGSGQAGTVIAIEKDHRLINNLREKFKNNYSIKIIESDVLKLNIEELFRNLKLEIRTYHYKVVGNIPYYITSNLLRTILEKWPKPELIVLTIQKEVAQRILAKPPHTNLLALSIQYYAEPEIVSYVSKNNFSPVPKVDSAIIKLATRDKQQATKEETEKLFKLLKTGFSGKRKQLASNLSKQLKIPKEKVVAIFEKLDLRPIIRAENLSLEQWKKLSIYLSE